MGLNLIILSVFVSRIILIAAAAASNYDPYKPNLIRSEYFQMGQTNVSFCHQINSGKGIPIIMPNSTQGTYGAVQPATPLSLTPTKCSNFKCTKIPIFHPPVMSSCKTIVQTLLNNSTGTFIAPPSKPSSL
ncbi:uncharacterized protein PGTG_10820 [Puccinia graminis f. sp. tritici CRL 75-36-700-3]|uniref:Secreted protein n=2 Tax=Puccinia graminis f. sp. tritici (strain CRL 75-36-700-3 / race SCCL) TaxID=418459 RepID=E3KK36_PUCGT|nr:uncharacterized protein PGTG_10820 [Puccinia graminis f. sp. tritici CRL 75-36-700-3]EFP84661.1 hypothetical protein PGTG_10820 [Puccinia graminis f. sp. tritici CRL 75-36-700-3]